MRSFALANFIIVNCCHRKVPKRDPAVDGNRHNATVRDLQLDCIGNSGQPKYRSCVQCSLWNELFLWHSSSGSIAVKQLVLLKTGRSSASPSRWLSRWETHLHTSSFPVIICGQQNNSQRAAVFISFCLMNTDHLMNTRSCSLTSLNVNLLQPSDAIIVCRGRKTWNRHQKTRNSKKQILHGISFLTYNANNLEHNTYFFSFLAFFYATLSTKVSVCGLHAEA